MALQLTYEQRTKKMRVRGSLALSSIETINVDDNEGNDLEAGYICVHRADGIEVASWMVMLGTASADTHTAGLASLFSPRPLQARMSVFLILKDGGMNTLASGYCDIINSCNSDGAEAAPSGGPLVAPAEVDITDAGCPVMLRSGSATPCTAADHASFIGIALNTGSPADDIQIRGSGPITISGWGLTPGLAYWLPQTGQRITSTPGEVALLVGIAQDADTLILTGGRLGVQPRAGGSSAEGFYLVWDAEGKRLTERQAVDTSSGEASAGMIPRLCTNGKLHVSMIPDQADDYLSGHVNDVNAHTDIRQAITTVSEIAQSKQAPLNQQAIAALAATSAPSGNLNAITSSLADLIDTLKEIFT
jgi:hypothetical protein